MRLKYYATVKDYGNLEKRKDIIDFFIKYMNAKVTKSGGHTNLKLHGQIDLLMCEGSNSTQTGYHVIKFEDNEKAIFDDAVAKAKEGIKTGKASLSVDLHHARWGTSFFEFVDPIGTSWVYEINTKALNGVAYLVNTLF